MEVDLFENSDIPGMDMSNSGCSQMEVDLLDLDLYPDLLSKNGIICILRQRYIDPRGTDLDSLEKEALVDLYNRYIIPLPQRKHRNNRRGQIITKKQILLSKKRKIFSDEESPPKKMKSDISNCSSSGLINSPGNLVSRLKPPPSCINFDRKVVKLNVSKKTDSHISETSAAKPLHRNIVNLEVTSSTSETESKNCAPAVLGTSKQEVRQQVISGKRKSTSMEGDAQGGCDKMDEATPPVTKKLNKITWP